MESMQSPNWSQRQTEDIDRINQVAQVGQRNVAEAVRSEIFGPSGFDQHWKGAGNEDRGRDRTSQHR